MLIFRCSHNWNLFGYDTNELSWFVSPDSWQWKNHSTTILIIKNCLPLYLFIEIKFPNGMAEQSQSSFPISFQRCMILLSFQDICPNDWWQIEMRKSKRKKKTPKIINSSHNLNLDVGQYQLKITLRSADIARMFICLNGKGDCWAQSMNGTLDNRTAFIL